MAVRAPAHKSRGYVVELGARGEQDLRELLRVLQPLLVGQEPREALRHRQRVAEIPKPLLDASKSSNLLYSVVVKTVTEQTTVMVIARIPVELKQELVARAAEHDRSLSGEMRVLLRASLAADRQGER